MIQRKDTFVKQNIKEKFKVIFIENKLKISELSGFTDLSKEEILQLSKSMFNRKL